MNFRTRSAESEDMDNLSCSGAVLDRTLHELDVINALLGGNTITARSIATVLKKRDPGQVTSVADLGCGSGDLLRQTAGTGRAQGHRLTLTGIDANPNVIEYARHRIGTNSIHFEALNIFSREFARLRFDIVMATLFFHHLPTPVLIDFLRQLKTQVTTAIIVNDLHRHWLAYYSIKWLTRGFSSSPMVKHDAPVSVLRGFSRHEIESILQQAHLDRYTLRWRWAFRWELIIWLD